MISALNCDTDTAVELHRILTASIIRGFSLTESAAAVLADQITIEMRREAGGGPIYIPAPLREARNAQIRADFRGNNHDELAAEHGISRRQVERIVSNNCDTSHLKMSESIRQNLAPDTQIR